MCIRDSRAMEDVREGRTIPVPKHLKDTHYKGSAKLGHGKGYQYAHDFEGGYVRQDYLGVEKSYYVPTDRGYEATISERMRRLREGQPAGQAPAGAGTDAKPGDLPNSGESAVSDSRRPEGQTGATAR